MKKKVNMEQEQNNQQYVDKVITDVLEENYMPYVMTVITSRAIPEIDGFKPSHRKILYTMYKMKLLGGKRTKSANVVGQTMKLNPHGDQAIYATMVRLARGNESMRVPYIDSKGNFGKVTSRDMKFAAPRYTEVKLEKFCETIFADIDKQNVTFIENYDGTMMEPTLLPTMFPNILANPNKGIAVGMASNIPSFNLVELCNFTMAYLKNRDVNVFDYMPAPDFSTYGSLIFDQESMARIYDTGIGSFKLRGHVQYIAKGNLLEITEIPYTTTVENIMDKVIDLIKQGKIKEVSDIRDETDLKGLRIAIDLKRGTDPELMMAKLYKMTPLEDTFSCNFNVLVDGAPKVMGVREILDHWITFRKSCIRKGILFDIAKYKKRLHLMIGLSKILLDIDHAIDIIRHTAKEKEVVPRLQQAFAIDELQAEYVADIKLRNINREYILKSKAEIEQLEGKINELTALHDSESKVEALMTEQLKEVRDKYGDARRTQLVQDVAAYEEKEVIEDYNLKVFITKDGYIKKVSLVSLRSSGDHKLKEDDTIVAELEGSNIDELLFFSNAHNVYKVKAYDIEDTKVSELGGYLPNLLELEEGEEIIYTVMTNDFSGHLLIGFENGKVAKIPLSSYETKQNRKKLVKAYSDVSPVVRMIHLLEEEEITLIRQSSKEVSALIIHSENIPVKVTKSSRGVQVFRLKKGSSMSGMFVTSAHAITNEAEYRRDSIPNAGNELDAMDILTINKWIRS